MRAGWKSSDSLLGFSFKWSLITLVISVLTLKLLPFHEVKFELPYFYVETLLWLLLSAVAGAGLYYASFPQPSPRWPGIVAAILLPVLLAFTLFHPIVAEDSPSAILSELYFKRGGCGLIISVLALLHSLFLFRWARHGAARSPLHAGAWAGLSAAGLGCCLIQPVCIQDSAVHLWFWHFLPLLGLCLVSAWVARFFLKW